MPARTHHGPASTTGTPRAVQIGVAVPTDHHEAAAAPREHTTPWQAHAMAETARWLERCSVEWLGDGDAAEPVLDPRAVKRLRVAIRRVREIVAILVASHDERRADAVDDALGRIARRLGPIRDLDVALAQLAERREATSGDLERAAIDELTGELQRARAKATRRARKRLRRDALADARREAQLALVEALAFGDGAAAARWWDGAGWWRAAVAEAIAADDLDGLHGLRDAARRLRYGLELFGDDAPPAARVLLGPARDLQHALGEHRDRALLELRLHERVARARSRHRVALQRGLECSAVAATGPRSAATQRALAAIDAMRGFAPTALPRARA